MRCGEEIVQCRAHVAKSRPALGEPNVPPRSLGYSSPSPEGRGGQGVRTLEGHEGQGVRTLESREVRG